MGTMVPTDVLLGAHWHLPHRASLPKQTVSLGYPFLLWSRRHFRDPRRHHISVYMQYPFKKSCPIIAGWNNQMFCDCPPMVPILWWCPLPFSKLQRSPQQTGDPAVGYMKKPQSFRAVSENLTVSGPFCHCQVAS